MSSLVRNVLRFMMMYTSSKVMQVLYSINNNKHPKQTNDAHSYEGKQAVGRQSCLLREVDVLRGHFNVSMQNHSYKGRIPPLRMGSWGNHPMILKNDSGQEEGVARHSLGNFSTMPTCYS